MASTLRILYVLSVYGHMAKPNKKCSNWMAASYPHELGRYLTHETKGYYHMNWAGKRDFQKGLQAAGDHHIVLVNEEAQNSGVSLEVMSWESFTKYFESWKHALVFEERLECLSDLLLVYPAPRQAGFYRSKSRLIQQLDHITKNITFTNRPRTAVLTDASQFTKLTVLKREGSCESRDTHTKVLGVTVVGIWGDRQGTQSACGHWDKTHVNEFLILL
ncbi:hypothetical protein GGX14DRAFT_674816 [Mycena pura]|uniref:Uncharacterized protein n=1 Tax=Mycena pura TaxID=153505 RepID=A0AAD6VR42_9AGAR|nr:hypothetical protein GGX14DRAFT_674816 [Mycena pura]